MQAHSQQAGRDRKRVSVACEACRTAKAKCRPSQSVGTCDRCFTLKKECIFRTSQRPGLTNAPPTSAAADHRVTAPQPQPNDFSIEYDMPAKTNLNDGFHTLRVMHDRIFDNMFPELDTMETTLTVSQLTADILSRSDPATRTNGIGDFWRQPTFSKASAESLLASFKNILSYHPCITLLPDESVSRLAATRPFVLLAILTVASGSTMTQTHSLYDHEFRKALALKHVAGGEKSLELLQGLLVYCGWYPFHLRPKNNQLLQYLRMAGDIIQDLQLDQEYQTAYSMDELELTGEQVDNIRAYLGYIYLVSIYVVAWKGKERIPTGFKSWAITCCNLLERHAQVQGDRTLAGLVRISGIFWYSVDIINDRETQSLEHRFLMLTGLDQKYYTAREYLESAIRISQPLAMQAMFVDVYLDSGTLIALPASQIAQAAKYDRLPPTPTKLYNATLKLKTLLDYMHALDESSLLSFTIGDWTRLILSVILSFRLSFPLKECPGFDPAWARSHLRLDQFLWHMSLDGYTRPPGTTDSNNVLMSSRAVIGVVREKYEHRLRALGEVRDAREWDIGRGCPVIHPSSRNHSTTWNTEPVSLGHSATSQGEDVDGSPFHDLWTTMTMGWADSSNSSGSVGANLGRARYE